MRATRLRRLAGQQGQNTIEWAGVLLVVAVLVVGVAAVTPRVIPSITHGMTCIVEKIFGNSCESSSYVVSTQTKTVGWNGRVLIVDGSHEFTVTETRYSDGHVTITLQNDANLGVSVQAGVRAELGSLGLEAQASAGIGGYGEGSTTWTFPNTKAADQAFAKLTQGSGVGTLIQDGAHSVPLVGGLLGGLLDDAGVHGAPSSGSISSQNITAKGYGGGISAKAGAVASAEIPYVVSAKVSANIAAGGGFTKIVAGPQKGDWQETVSLNAGASASVSSDLLGADASAGAKGDGSLVVTMDPNGNLVSVEVDAVGTGTWGLHGPTGPQLPSSAQIPGGSGSESHGSGGSSSGETPSGGTPASETPSGGSPSGTEPGAGSEHGGSSEPLLKVDSENTDEKGVGSEFSGDLNLTEHPDAASAVSRMLAGDLSQIPTVINDMNTEGTETVRSFKATDANSSVGIDVNVGVGGGGGFDNTSSSTTTVGTPQTRTNGGPWVNAGGS